MAAAATVIVSCCCDTNPSSKAEFKVPLAGYAHPRLFVKAVRERYAPGDPKSATAILLGCEYRLLIDNVIMVGPECPLPEKATMVFPFLATPFSQHIAHVLGGV
jgi:hypothetical protein